MTSGVDEAGSSGSGSSRPEPRPAKSLLEKSPLAKSLLANHKLPDAFGKLRDLGRLPREQLLSRLSYSLKQPLFTLPVYHFTLSAGVATGLKANPPDAWPGNAADGADIVQGRFCLLGRGIEKPAPLWHPVGAGRDWCEAINAFEWLRDLRAAGGDGPRRCARDHVANWIHANERWNSVTWEPVTMGRRLAHWLAHFEFFAASAEIEFRQRLLRSIARQARHLARVLPAGLAGSDAISAIKGLIYAGVCLPGAEAQLARGLQLLIQELPRQLMADGGQLERSPERHFLALRDLIDIRATLLSGGHECPEELQGAIDLMTPVLRLLQHGDGGLALFNDSRQSEGYQVDMVLQRAGARGRALMTTPSCGFQRLQAGRSLIIVDAGPPPPPGFDGHLHAGTLSFEMSVGRERLIVNCGAQSGENEWQSLQRATAAHSTLTLADTNSTEILPGRSPERRVAVVTCKRDDADGQVWLELGHDGYRELYGLSHERRLYLNATGDDLRGEDALVALEGDPVPAFAIRFHLHPQVKASLAQGGGAVLLSLPKGGGWRFRAQGAALTVEPSIYLGQDGHIRRSQQIVLSHGGAPGIPSDSMADPEADPVKVKWALRRETKPRAKA